MVFDVIEIRKWIGNSHEYKPPELMDFEILRVENGVLYSGYITRIRELRLLRDYKRATYTLKRAAEYRQRQFTGNLRKPFGETLSRAERMQAIERIYPRK